MDKTRTCADIRFANEEDFPAVCEIVNFYIRTTVINFRTAPQDYQEWQAEWKTHRGKYPWYVAEVDGEVVGIAYATPWKGRNAYDWTTETTVYVSHNHHGQGIGRSLYAALLKTLKVQGYRSAIGVIALPNAASVALHTAFGYEHVGGIRAAGFKHGGWHDVSIWQHFFVLDDEPPSPIALLEHL